MNVARRRNARLLQESLLPRLLCPRGREEKAQRKRRRIYVNDARIAEGGKKLRKIIRSF